MDYVEIKLNSFLYRFRRLTWTEQATLKFPPKEDQRLILMAHAMTDVSGFTIASVADALTILKRIPAPIQWRLWVIYQGKLPPERYYSCGGLYEAPEPVVHIKRMFEEGDRTKDEDEILDAQLAQRFGAEELREARELESRMAAQAQQVGTVTRPKETSHA